ncbi:hypothetical protein LRS03_01135 [Rhizobacter sp. J219]|uniref:hypothetical protein n=1 Tax=Rhizobacter sp. J219 TaxID=2898430 RepID=UPI0021509480|nr:hypothetical protein [Rhizobacter sp. J219]MCR5881545.1 hypothetical protein [Rhizobacter sp. J219]
MDDSKIKTFLNGCTDEERHDLFRELRKLYRVHELEDAFGAPAEVILEAIHRAPELTQRMLKGVIADAAFAQFVVPAVAKTGWKDVTPPGNHSYDYALDDGKGVVTVQVKLQRSEKGQPVITTGTKFGLAAGMYMVEPQRTRGGKKKAKGENGEVEEKKTRPYLYTDFNVIAVSLRPATKDWASFRYSVANWLLPNTNPLEIRTYQPVSMKPNDDWTDSFEEVAEWYRSAKQKRIRNEASDLASLF